MNTPTTPVLTKTRAEKTRIKIENKASEYTTGLSLGMRMLSLNFRRIVFGKTIALM